MVKEYFTLEIYGSNFYPNKVDGELYGKLSNIIVPGQIGLKGRYKGLKSPYGSATLVLSEAFENKLLYFLEFISNYISKLRDLGATNITLNAVFAYHGQCNFELDTLEIELLNKLKIPFVFSAYEVNDFVE